MRRLNRLHAVITTPYADDSNNAMNVNNDGNVNNNNVNNENGVPFGFCNDARQSTYGEIYAIAKGVCNLSAELSSSADKGRSGEPRLPRASCRRLDASCIAACYGAGRLNDRTISGR